MKKAHSNTDYRYRYKYRFEISTSARTDSRIYTILCKSSPGLIILADTNKIKKQIQIRIIDTDTNTDLNFQHRQGQTAVDKQYSAKAALDRQTGLIILTISLFLAVFS